MKNRYYPNPKAPFPWRHQQYLTNPATPCSSAPSTRKQPQQPPTRVFGTNCKHPNINTTEFCAFCACKQRQKPANNRPFTFSAHTQRPQPKHNSDHDITTENAFSIYHR
jgi:hypothetical protein